MYLTCVLQYVSTLLPSEKGTIYGQKNGAGLCCTRRPESSDCEVTYVYLTPSHIVTVLCSYPNISAPMSLDIRIIICNHEEVDGKKKFIRNDLQYGAIYVGMVCRSMPQGGNHSSRRRPYRTRIGNLLRTEYYNEKSSTHFLN